MKRLLLIFLAFSIATSSFAFSSSSFRHHKACDIFIPIGSTGQKISLLDLSAIGTKDFETLSGRHLSFFDKMGFKMAQRKLRNSIKADGTIDNKKLNKFLEQGDHSTGFHVGGFALGFLVGIIGVLIAYLINDDYKRNRVKWAWIGFGIFVVLYLILILALISSVGY